MLAADQFVVRAADGPDVVAGYPWFGSYLSDTMTGYEGLFLDTGRADEGRELIAARTRAAMRVARPWGPHGWLDARCGWCTRSTGTSPGPATAICRRIWPAR